MLRKLSRHCQSAVIRLRQDCRGATMIEYGFTVALIALAMDIALSSLGSALGTILNNVSAKL